MPEQKTDIDTRFGRTLIVVAHPDDEAIGCGVLLQRLSHATVAFMTDGAPADPYFWDKFGSRNAYAEARARESKQALDATRAEILRFGARDQQLMFHLDAAMDWLRQVVTIQKPQSLLTHAYEGGHPDHDCCSFLCDMISREFAVPVWEMPLYSRVTGKLVRQSLPRDVDAFSLTATIREEEQKRRMIAAYKSQEEFLQTFDTTTERYAVHPKHDYARRPHAGKLNYECWGWEIAGSDLCKAFALVMQKNHRQRAKSA
jgi:LmbE family N-acetylglucosaminyl deacetylase